MSALIDNADCENESRLLNTQNTQVAEDSERSLYKTPVGVHQDDAATEKEIDLDHKPQNSTGKVFVRPIRLLDDDDQQSLAFVEEENENSEISVCASDVNFTIITDNLNATESLQNSPRFEVNDGVQDDANKSEDAGIDDVVTEETDEERIRRELEESERLAWELMQQESMETYQMQVNFMQEMAGQMSEEDLAAIRDAMGGGAPVVVAAGDDNDQAGGEDDADEEEDGNDESDVDNWDYDRLLSLGQALGDVKTERWRRKAPEIIKSLEKSTFAAMQDADAAEMTATQSVVSSASASEPSATTATASSSSAPAPCKRIRLESKCMVCLEPFERCDAVTLLSCRHFFHDTCTAGWLADHNSCPICKTPVLKSP